MQIFWKNEMDFDALLKAIKETVNGNKSRRKAACDNGLSSSTLSRYVIKVKEVFEEISTVSDVDLMDFLRKSRMFHPSKVTMSTSKEAAKQDKKVDKQNEMDFDALLKAIKEHLIENKPLRAAARDNGTSRTTLSRYSEKIKKEFEDLSAVTDEELMNYIRKRNMHLPCTMEDQNEFEFDALIKAIKCCLVDKKGIRPTARENNLPHATLDRHVNKVKAAFEDVSTVDDTDLINFVRGNRMKIPSNMNMSTPQKSTSNPKKANATPEKPNPTPKKEDDEESLNFDTLVKAIKDCLLNKKSTQSSAKAYGIARTTLTRHRKKVEESFVDLSAVSDNDLLEFVRRNAMHLPSNMVFSLEVENELVEYIMKCIKDENSLTVTELRKLAYELATRLDKCPEEWKKNQIAGKKWYYKFMNRHPELSLKTPEQILIISEMLTERELQVVEHGSDPLRIATPSKIPSHGQKSTGRSDLTSTQFGTTTTSTFEASISPIKRSKEQETSPSCASNEEEVTSLSTVLESIDPSQVASQRMSKRNRTPSEKSQPSKKTSPPAKRKKRNTK